MKFVTLIAMVLFAQNAFAQTSESTEPSAEPTTPEPAPEQPALPSLGEAGDQAHTACLSTDDTNQCCNEYGSCVQSLGESSEQCAAVARLCGHENVNAALQDSCRQRNASVQGNECICAAGLNWNSESDKTCCTTNPAAYERRRSACERSGGTYHCSSHGGWCGCPLGMDHPIDADGDVDHSVCDGEAVNQERIEEMRDRLATLQAEAEAAGRQIASLQAERDTLQRQLDDAQARLAHADEVEGQLAELERSIDNLERRLAEMDAELVYLRHLRDQHQEFIDRQAQVIADLGGIPPLPPGIPGEDEVFQETAGSTEPSPFEPTPPPSEEEEETAWCNRGFGEVLLCYILPAVATAGLVVGSVCAAGYCEPTDTRTSYSYH